MGEHKDEEQEEEMKENLCPESRTTRTVVVSTKDRALPFRQPQRGDEHPGPKVCGSPPPPMALQCGLRRDPHLKGAGTELRRR